MLPCMRKEIMLDCVVAISSFLIVAADTDNLTCEPPPKINDSIPFQIDGDEHAIGTSVTYSCNYGYVSRNSINQVSTCIANKTTGKAEWTVPEISCIPRSCGDPGNVKNGRRIGNFFTFPNKVDFECEEGYKRVGMKARYCQAGGEWSGTLPSCEPIVCSVPPDIENGEVMYSSLEYGAELKYKCYFGYMETHNGLRYCDGDGTWSGVAPECVEAKCIKPIPPKNGQVYLIGEPKVGSVATFTCNPGLKLHGASTTKCLMQGQWTYDPPKCLNSCLVPHIANGEMRRLTVRYNSRRKKEEIITTLSEGEFVEMNAMLSFRCKEDFAIVEGDSILQADQVDVLCNDGNWSRDLHCQQTSCLGDPPKTENGIAMVGDRRHGYTIWYQCDNARYTKIPGNVTCYFGTWIGIPPLCLSSTPCFTKDLDFPGLVKPSQAVVVSLNSFYIACTHGYRLSTSAKIITCKEGKWDIKENPCSVARNDAQQSRATTATLPLNVQDKPSRSSSSDTQSSKSQPPEQCHCTYVGAGHHVHATVGPRRLKDGDRVRKGETVTFSCKGQRMLTWENGLRLSDNASITCTTCRRWQVTDSPDCKVLEIGGPSIMLDDSLQIQPGGAVEVQVKKPITLMCVSTSNYPLWSFRGSPVQNVNLYTMPISNYVVYFYSQIHIPESGYGNAGLYTCHLSQLSNFRQAAVNLRVQAIVCSFFPTIEDLRVSYSHDNQVGSRATFSCPRHATIVGSTISECRGDGTWSSPVPYCLNKTTCALFPRVSGLKIEYSNENFPGSNASFSCTSESVLNGNSFSVCLENGNWSYQMPICEALCSIGDLSVNVKRGVVPDMTDVTDEFVSFGSMVPLACEGGFVPDGNSVAVCGEQGKWKIGNFQCISGCALNIEASSHLQVQPLKDYYRMGEQITLLCPDGEILSNDVERLMCLGDLTWHDTIPDCI